MNISAPSAISTDDRGDRAGAVWHSLLVDLDGGAPPTRYEVVADAAWKPALLGAADRAAPGDTLLVLGSRGARMAALRLLSKRRWTGGRSVRIAEIERTVRGSGLRIDAKYVVWPSVEAPRLVLPANRYGALRWAQRSGVLGGGGTNPFGRWLARSPMFTPVAFLLAPAVAVVASRPPEDERA